MKRFNPCLSIVMIALTLSILSCSSDTEDSTVSQTYNGELPVLEIGDIWMHKGDFVGIEEVLVTEVIGEKVVGDIDCYEMAGSIDPPLFGAQYITGLFDKSTLDEIESHMYGKTGGEPFEATYTTSYEYSNPFYPLTIGNKWTIVETEITEYRIMGEIESETEVNESTWEVKAIEDVEVPAGTFRCFRIERYDETGALLEVKWHSDIDKGQSIKEVDYENDIEIELIGYSVSLNGEKRSGGEPVQSLGDVPAHIPSPFHEQSAGNPEFSFEELSEIIDIIGVLPDSFKESSVGVEEMYDSEALSYFFEKDDLSQFIMTQFRIPSPFDRSINIGLLESDEDTIEDVLMEGIRESDDNDEPESGFFSMKIKKPDIGEYAAFGEGIRSFHDSLLNYEILIFIRGNVYVLAISFFADDQSHVSMEDMGDRIDDMLLGNIPDKIPENASDAAY